MAVSAEKCRSMYISRVGSTDCELGFMLAPCSQRTFCCTGRVQKIGYTRRICKVGAVPRQGKSVYYKLGKVYLDNSRSRQETCNLILDRGISMDYTTISLCSLLNRYDAFCDIYVNRVFTVLFSRRVTFPRTAWLRFAALIKF